MKVNVKQILVDLDGDSLTLPDQNGVEKSIELGTVMVKALLMPDQGKSNVDDHIKRFTLAQDIHRAEAEVDIKAEDIALIKQKLPDLGFSPLITGQVVKLIDG